MTLIRDMFVEMHQELAQVSDSPGLDSQVLLAHVLDQSRTWVLAHPETSLTAVQIERIVNMTNRLVNGEPLPYVLGHWEFFGLDFLVNPDTLIPRPETELLVENALTWLQQHPQRRLALDLGTGSGCIAISLASQVQDLRVIATDISLRALQAARQNANRNKVSKQVSFLQADLLPPTESQFDLIGANLPYIPTATLHSLNVYGKEPERALNGGQDGLDMIRKMLDLAPNYISPGGLILVEIESTQGVSAFNLAKLVFPFALIQVLPDLAGLDRLLRIQI